jgi:hypothetical protein
MSQKERETPPLVLEKSLGAFVVLHPSPLTATMTPASQRTNLGWAGEAEHSRQSPSIAEEISRCPRAQQ